MTQINNIIDLGKGSNYVMAFCYPKSGPLLIKGPAIKVSEYLRNNIDGLFHYRLVQYSNKENEGIWLTNCEAALEGTQCIFVDRRGKSDNQRYKAVVLINNDGMKELVQFRRIPHNYINEFDTIQNLL